MGLLPPPGEERSWQAFVLPAQRGGRPEAAAAAPCSICPLPAGTGAPAAGAGPRRRWAPRGAPQPLPEERLSRSRAAGRWQRSRREGPARARGRYIRAGGERASGAAAPLNAAAPSPLAAVPAPLRARSPPARPPRPAPRHSRERRGARWRLRAWRPP